MFRQRSFAFSGTIKKGHSQGVKLCFWEWMPRVAPGSYTDLVELYDELLSDACQATIQGRL